MMRPNRIPLFPLDVVLLPAMPLPLHIFEPRYRVMIGRCLNERLAFGMVLASGQALATVGCTAEIVEKIKDYPDGRMDILAEGRAVFHLTEVLEEKEYHEGIVEYRSDDPSPLDAEKEARLIEMFQQCHTLLFGQRWSGAARNEATTLVYRMAPCLPLELEQKQALLEMRAEDNRRDFLMAWIAEFLPKLAQRRQASERAGGNGHAPH